MHMLISRLVIVLVFTQLEIGFISSHIRNNLIAFFLTKPVTYISLIRLSWIRLIVCCFVAYIFAEGQTWLAQFGDHRLSVFGSFCIFKLLQLVRFLCWGANLGLFVGAICVCMTDSKILLCSGHSISFIWNIKADLFDSAWNILI
jgi:hypothetical protein